MQYSSDEISIEEECLNKKRSSSTTNLKYLPHWPPVNIEFQDLVYTVPDISGEYMTNLMSKQKKKINPEIRLDFMQNIQNILSTQ